MSLTPLPCGDVLIGSCVHRQSVTADAHLGRLNGGAFFNTLTLLG